VEEEVSGECGRSVRVEQNSDGYPDSKCLTVNGALSCNREHTRYEFKRIDSRGQAGELHRVFYSLNTHTPLQSMLRGNYYSPCQVVLGNLCSNSSTKHYWAHSRS
jgi:hypothetical protein